MPATDPGQTIAFTAVPRGFAIGAAPSLRVAVHVSPRLSYAGDGGTLASFPDWVSWPSTEIVWRVELHNDTLEPTVVSAPPDPALWQALFRPTLGVDSFTGDPGPERTVRGYSYATLADELRGAYTDPSGFSRSPFAEAARDVLEATRWEAGSDSTTDLREALEQYLGFWTAPPTDELTPGALDANFHDRISLVGDHAPLLEKLGLVVVLEIPTVTAPRETTVAVTGRFTASADVTTTLLSPRTRTIFDPANQIFAAQRRTATDGEHTERLHLDLANPAFTVHDLHVDAATAGNLALGVGTSTDTGAAPTSGGIVLALAGRMRRVQTDVTNAEAAATGSIEDPDDPPERFAEDLIVGHHIEIGVGPDSAWRGLGHRQVEYVVKTSDDSELSFTAIDEAAVTAVGRQALPDDPSQLLVSDVVMRWDGWSLAVPRPGTMLLQGDPLNASVDEVPGRPDDTPLTLHTDFTDTSAEGADGLLPTLRYGQVYCVRGRAVDVTGGAPRWDEAVATPLRPYLRYDPAPTPLVLPPPAESLTRGESARAVVVRSNPRSGEAPTVKSSRTLVPPRATVDTVLLHGWFDDSDSGVPDASEETWDLIGDLDNAEVPAEGPTPAGPTREPVARQVDWLPDPFATHVRLGLLAPDGDEVDGRVVSFVPPLDDAGSGRASLREWQSIALLVEGVTAGTFPTMAQSETATPHRIVTIGLPPSASARIALRPSPRAQLLPLHGLVAWDDPYTPEERAQRVADGLLPQLTPTTYVDVVHAVRQPLVDPVIDAAVPTRGRGEKDPLLDVTLQLHADSTSRVSVFASWVEQVDAGPQLVAAGIKKPTTRTVPRTRVIESSIDVDHENAVGTFSFQGLVPFSDLRRVDLTLKAVATSRFVPEFREVITLVDGSRLPPGVDPQSVAVLLNGSALTLDTDYRISADGSGWRLTLRGGLDPAEVVIEGVVGTVLATSTVPKSVIVRSAVRPEPPKVLYAIPAFAASEPERDEDGAYHGGRGASRLRIYLERPWWSSGTGEQLAVIVNTGTPTDPDGTSPAGRLVSLYGADPAITPGGGYPLHKQDLTSGALVTGTKLDETVSTAPYTARAHDVLYDAERDLYYTEIQLRPQLAGTFVRLAVARYQPYVTDGVSQLSRIVTMDPIQVLPPRELTVRRRTSRHADKVTVDVKGSVHRGPIESVAPFLKVSIQVKSVKGAGEDLGWDTVILTTAKRLSNGKGYKSLALDVPPGTPPGARVLVEELETWFSEGERGQAVEAWAPGKQPKNFKEAKLHLQARRITWVATTPLPRR